MKECQCYWAFRSHPVSYIVLLKILTEQNSDIKDWKEIVAASKFMEG